MARLCMYVYVCVCVCVYVCMCVYACVCMYVPRVLSSEGPRTEQLSRTVPQLGIYPHLWLALAIRGMAGSLHSAVCMDRGGFPAWTRRCSRDGSVTCNDTIVKPRW
jgi:hypothetical protein